MFTPQNSCRVTATEGVDCTLPLQLDPPQNKSKQNKTPSCLLLVRLSAKKPLVETREQCANGVYNLSSATLVGTLQIAQSGPNSQGVEKPSLNDITHAKWISSVRQMSHYNGELRFH